MSKKAHPVLTAIERSPILRALPLGAQMVWVRLAMVLASEGLETLRIGFEVPNLRQLALITGVTEPDIETHLEAILSAGLLKRGPDGALSAPDAVSPDRRAQASRINGLKGGRPRKNKPESRPAQAGMIFPIAGGGSTPQTQPKEKLDVGFVAKLSLEDSKAKLAVPDGEVERVTKAALAEGRIGREPTIADRKLVQQWMADGIGEAMILDTVRARVKPGISHLGYFAKAVAEASALGVGKPGRACFGLSARSLAFTRATEEWQAFGRRGPQPHPTWFAEDGSRVAA